MIQISRSGNENPKPLIKVEGRTLENNSSRKPKEEPLDLRDFQPVEKKNDYTIKELEGVVESTNKLLFEQQSTHFKFEIHEGTGRVMINLVDTKTDEVIKEMPPEKILDLVASIWELVGILVDERG
ncbi:flagellar protein FlaG [Alkalibacter mobilis]|uniref:flagellar protein FlaG n=1 Tax=Alkalibacter mobilis TaxID=2787712 RepID=UPI001A9B3937|nr:flagellar protein FlaG [Alkalibacter mobilis]